MTTPITTVPCCSQPCPHRRQPRWLLVLSASVFGALLALPMSESHARPPDTDIVSARESRTSVRRPSARVLLSLGGLPRRERRTVLRFASASLREASRELGVKLSITLDPDELSGGDAWSVCQRGIDSTGPAIDLAACIRVGRDGQGEWTAETLATPIGPRRGASTAAVVTDQVRHRRLASLGRRVGRTLAPLLSRWAKRSEVVPTDRGERSDGHILLDGRGRISVGGSAFEPLPLRLPVGDEPVDVVVISGHCPEAFVGTIDLARPRRVRFECRIPDWATLRISTDHPDTDVYVATSNAGGQDWHHRLDSTGHSAVLDVPSVDRLEVTCIAERTVPWRQRMDLRSFVAAPGKLIDVECRPQPISEVVFITTDAPGTRVYLGAEQIRPWSTDDPGYLHESRREDELQPGKLYWFKTTRSGRITAIAAGRQPSKPALAPPQGGQVRRVDLRLGGADAPPEPLPSARMLGRLAWPDGPLSIGLTGGISLKHQRLATQLGILTHLEPGWSNCLSFEGGLAMEQAEEPVFLSRWESETRLTRGYAAMRCAYRRWPVQPFGALGAFYVPSVAIGPWFSAGASVPLPFGSFDLIVAMPTYVYDKLGHLGFESYATLRFSLPGREDQ